MDKTSDYPPLANLLCTRLICLGCCGRMLQILGPADPLRSPPPPPRRTTRQAVWFGVVRLSPDIVSESEISA